MKKIITFVMSSMMFIPLANSALAPSDGFSGNVTFLTGVRANSSNLDVGQSAYQTQTDLDSTGSNEADSMYAVLGSLLYTFGEQNNKQLFMGTSRDDIISGTLAFEIGYRQQLESGMTVDFSVLPTLISGDVWDDPYAVDTEREETDLTGNVVRLQLGKIMGSSFNVDMAAGESDVKHENTGLKGLGLTSEERALMTRERKYFYFKTGFQHYLPNQGVLLLPSVNVFSSDSKGDALSFLSAGVEVSLAKQIEKHSFALTLNAAVRNYDAENPIFSEIRKDKDYGAFVAYEYSDVLGYQNWSLVSLAGAKTTKSNINFYDFSQYVVSFGLGYYF
ncbi:DUF2860 family protein [uncultured Vibrio sp.]|uniref:DUF2860 family protein n=1 Tax=uncultured Vibrio sp. TaxID=114054 RepID=UPI0025DB414F|nr:DUF2860 family protein [uncultured Vibrio sp.]